MNVKKKATAKKATAKKTTVKKTTVKKTTVKKTTVKKTTVKKATVKKATVKKATVKKATVKKATVKKATVKKALAATTFSVVGKGGLRIDAESKVHGRARYIDDLSFPGMLYAAVRTSDWPHAEVTRIDVTDAQQVPGVIAVATHRDVPGENQIGAIKTDQPLLVETRARWVGDRIALIAAVDQATALAAARAVKVDAAPLPGVFDAEQALTPEAATLHGEQNLVERFHVHHGDVDKAFAKAEVVVENRYVAPLQEHAYLEPQGVIAVPEDGGMTIYGSMQCPFYIQGALSRLLGLPYSKIRVIQTTTGGAFGGKEDYPSEPAACAALLAHKSGRPVKFIYRRDQDMAWSTKRHRMVVYHRLGAKKDGTLVAADVRIVVDAGAYYGLTGIVSERANSSSIGPYSVPNVRVLTETVYTNNPFGGAYRGFGAPQAALAHEGQMDALAQALGRDPMDLREQNGLRPYSVAPWGEKLAPPVEYLDTLKAGARLSRWKKLRKQVEAHNATQPRLRLGLGIGSAMYGSLLHFGGQHLEGSGAFLQVHRDASISASIGLTEMGQGAFTIVARIAAEELGVATEQVHVTLTDTAMVPDSGPTVASRTTTMAGQAVLDAARQLRANLEPVASRILGCPMAQLKWSKGYVRGAGRKVPFADVVEAAFNSKVHLAASGWYAPPRKKYDRATGTGQPYSSYAYAVQIALVEVDVVSGMAKVKNFYCAHDVGRAIYPVGVYGQIEGGCVQGMGYALSERLVVDQGRILNPNFTDYLIPTIRDMPQIDIALIETGDEGGVKGHGTPPQAKGPYGSKGIGEPSLIPAAAAVANAVSHALGARMVELPLMPDVIMQEIARQELDGVDFVDVKHA